MAFDIAEDKANLLSNFNINPVSSNDQMIWMPVVGGTVLNICSSFGDTSPV